MDPITEENFDDTTPLQSVVITSEGNDKGEEKGKEDKGTKKKKKKNDKEVCLCILCFLILPFISNFLNFIFRANITWVYS